MGLSERRRTTRFLPRFWKALDEIPDATTDQRDWLLRLRDELPLVAGYLRPTGRRARSVSCPSPGGDCCPRRVVRHRDGRLRGVCGNHPAGCDSIDLVDEDIDILTLDREGLAAALRPAFGAVRYAVGDQSDPVIWVGVHGVAAGVGVPVLLAVPGPRESMLTIADLPKEPSAILVPTPSSLGKELGAEIFARGHEILALTSTVGADERSTFVGVLPPAELLAKLRAKGTQSSEVVSRAWSLPPDAHWEDLTFDLVSDQVLNVMFRGTTRRFEPDQLGMRNQKNGRPTVAWSVVLTTMAQTGGSLSWKDKEASPRFKKQKEALSSHLRAAFGIEEDPIYWGESAYRARFTIRDSRTGRRPLNR